LPLAYGVGCWDFLQGSFRVIGAFQADKPQMRKLWRISFERRLLQDCPSSARNRQWPAKLSTSDRGTCGPFGRIGSQMPTQLNWQNNFRFAREPTGIGTRQSRP
jgi:hypothetical protein